MKTTGPREQDWSCDEVIKISGALWIDKYLQIVMTSQNVDLQELHILLNSLAPGGWGVDYSLKLGNFKLISNLFQR